ncbi:putative serine/threonine-protein kinase [Nymphon striatum]|nr:putative serine/threonine-protein kinase [Nymphon striatum]
MAFNPFTESISDFVSSKKLQTAQNKLIRFVHGYHSRKHLVIDDFKKLDWLNVEKKVDFLFSSVHSTQSTASLHRPWSRSSRRRWKQSTLFDQYESSKTAWPVPVVESVFQPEFPIKGKIDESHFLVLKTIAKGAFGRVLRVQKKDNKKQYAMKVIYKSQVLLENAVQQCKDEVTIQSTLGHHSFIVKCQFFWQSKKHLFIVSDFIEHGELLTMWKEHGKFPENIVKLFIAELAIALDFLHNAGVIYRDLKMENILLDSDGHVQLIDFGLAKWLHHGDRARTICGTIQYMAPEILNMTSYTHAVDWWSLGIIMYALLMGHYPVDGVRDHTKMCDIVEDYDYSLPQEVFSSGIRQVNKKLLCKNPSRRLRNLIVLKREMCYRDTDFDEVKERKISPKKLIDEFINLKKKMTQVNGNIQTSNLTDANSVDQNPVIDMFEEFPWVSPAEVF